MEERMEQTAELADQAAVEQEAQEVAHTLALEQELEALRQELR